MPDFVMPQITADDTAFAVEVRDFVLNNNTYSMSIHDLGLIGAMCAIARSRGRLEGIALMKPGDDEVESDAHEEAKKQKLMWTTDSVVIAQHVPSKKWLADNTETLSAQMAVSELDIHGAVNVATVIELAAKEAIEGILDHLRKHPQLMDLQHISQVQNHTHVFRASLTILKPGAKG